MDWKKIYKEKLKTPEEAVKAIASGDRIYIHSTVCMPFELMEALADRKDELNDVLVFGGQALYPFKILQSPEYIGKIGYVTNFLANEEKVYYDVGNVTAMSVHLSRLAQCLTEVNGVNVLMMEVTEPDDEGYLYFGVGGTAAGWDIAEKASKVIFQINSAQPVPSGGVHHKIHISEVTSVTEVAPRPLPKLDQPEPSESDQMMAQHVLPYIEDGSTIQIGLGGLSNAIGYGLESRKDLAVHTEMYTDSMMYLYKKGCITGKQWASFALGSNELYDFVGNGPIQFAPISIINDPNEIAKNDKFVSINACLMADLTGQICSESIGHRQYSATGGQLDYVRGCAQSKGGKSFLCLKSVRKNKDGSLSSRIVLDLPRGSAVTTPRSDVMYVVTEYGVADLYLRTIPDRVNAMINIAHPDFREELREGAIREGLIRA